MGNKKFIQLQQKDIKVLKVRLHLEQRRICPILKVRSTYDKMVVDHKHKTKAETVGVDGAGLIRGCIHSQANVLEGKISNAYRRYGINKFIDLPNFLRNLAAYLERPYLIYIHPSEKPKAKRLGKRLFKKLQKLYRIKYPNRKELEYPKSGKMTPKWENLLEEFNLEY